MTNPSKARGTAWEKSIIDYLRSLGGYEVDRLTLNGKDDQGDIIVREDGGLCLIEAKATSRISLPDWWRQATTERDNYAKARGISPDEILPVIVHKRRQASVADGWVTLSLKEFFS